MGRSRQAVTVSIAALLILSSRAWGWNDTGHRIIASIIWDNLTPTSRAKVTEILKLHPRYEKDLLQNLPSAANDSEAARYAFSMAATWPDMVRNAQHPMHFAFNHPEWHCSNIPFAIGGQPVPPSTQPATTQPQDIVEALTSNLAQLKQPNTTPANKAIALCWVLHLGGDIHQPLHGCNLFSPQFPGGDQGGHLAIVLRDPSDAGSAKNLHRIWDELPGQYKDMEAITAMAAGLEQQPKFSRAALRKELEVHDFSVWLQESHDLAVQYVYLNGTLVCATAMQGTKSQSPIPALPKDYIDQAEKIAMSRVILAGYRTADLLNSIFDPQKP